MERKKYREMDYMQSKAVRLLAEGQVQPDPAPAEVFHVAGDHGTYTVVVGAHVALCTCPSDVRCSHIEAAVMWANARPEELALMQEALAIARKRNAAKAEVIFDRLAR